MKGGERGGEAFRFQNFDILRAIEQRGVSHRFRHPKKLTRAAEKKTPVPANPDPAVYSARISKIRSESPEIVPVATTCVWPFW